MQRIICLFIVFKARKVRADVYTISAGNFLAPPDRILYLNQARIRGGAGPLRIDVKLEVNKSSTLVGSGF